jgi:hypothetical protein
MWHSGTGVNNVKHLNLSIGIKMLLKLLRGILQYLKDSLGKGIMFSNYSYLQIVLIVPNHRSISQWDPKNSPRYSSFEGEYQAL